MALSEDQKMAFIEIWSEKWRLHESTQNHTAIKENKEKPLMK